ncbi:DNA-binding protein [Paenibacillus sp. GSMTC-2017]|uniref:DNA-binding protein n=1 Tax=Paenibacillus sp. GSMTC-2017 TaxID=2794350 RepID=UPI0018D70DA1|nr:DNA-binding protein [Paenibacillus sp. GSMTC-2017]MBH5320413.1 DNA-binding protein [Paenibacillus sp. GSMTC-2017]
MSTTNGNSLESDLPEGLSKPAIRALTGAGFVRLEQFTKLREKDVLRLHGFGPKGIRILKSALEARGQSFLSEFAQSNE